MMVWLSAVRHTGICKYGCAVTYMEEGVPRSVCLKEKKMQQLCLNIKRIVMVFINLIKKKYEVRFRRIWKRTDCQTLYF